MNALLGVISPGAASIAEPKPGDPHLGASLVPGVALGVAGYVTVKKHPVLGFLGAESVGLNGYRFLRNHPGDRTKAMTNLATTFSGVGGSLLWKNHPFWGFLLGMTVGAIATSYVPGSNAHAYRSRYL